MDVPESSSTMTRVVVNAFVFVLAYWFLTTRLSKMIRRFCPQGKLSALGGTHNRNILTLKDEVSLTIMSIAIVLISKSLFFFMEKHGFFQSKKMNSVKQYINQTKNFTSNINLSCACLFVCLHVFLRFCHNISARIFQKLVSLFD